MLHARVPTAVVSLDKLDQAPDAEHIACRIVKVVGTTRRTMLVRAWLCNFGPKPVRLHDKQCH
eukprot:6019392-Amphidinium_carterae.1